MGLCGGRGSLALTPPPTHPPTHTHTSSLMHQPLPLPLLTPSPPHPLTPSPPSPPHPPHPRLKLVDPTWEEIYGEDVERKPFDDWFSRDPLDEDELFWQVRG